LLPSFELVEVVFDALEEVVYFRADL